MLRSSVGPESAKAVQPGYNIGSDYKNINAFEVAEPYKFDVEPMLEDKFSDAFEEMGDVKTGKVLEERLTEEAIDGEHLIIIE